MRERIITGEKTENIFTYVCNAQNFYPYPLSFDQDRVTIRDSIRGTRREEQCSAHRYRTVQCTVIVGSLICADLGTTCCWTNYIKGKEEREKEKGTKCFCKIPVTLGL